MCTVKESARWFAARGKLDQAQESLKWVHGREETEELQKEFDETLAGIEEEARIKGNLTFKELLLPVNQYLCSSRPLSNSPPSLQVTPRLRTMRRKSSAPLELAVPPS